MAARRRRPARARLVTLSSDVGAAYAAQMKAVLAERLPPGRCVDLAHDLRAHDIPEAAFVVRAMAERFPAGTVHLVVVDPGVGGSRAPIVIACRDGSRLVGPDNGVLAPLAESLGGGTAYRLDPARLGVHERVGTTFDGRDLFAPAAALLAAGRSPSSLGTRTTLTPAGGAAPRRTAEGAQGTVAHVDRFGNLISDVPSRWLPTTASRVLVRLGRTRRPLPVVRSYEAAGPGRLAVLRSSFGRLEIARSGGRAAEGLGARVGTRLEFRWRATHDARRRRKR